MTRVKKERKASPARRRARRERKVAKRERKERKRRILHQIGKD